MAKKVARKRTFTTKPKVIAVSGTPGTGKTTLSKILAKKLRMKHLDVNKVIKENSLSEGYDAKRRCEIININKLKRALVALIRKTEKNLIIDSHMSHYLPKKYIDLCIITKCSLKILKKRLEKRNYHKTKIRENIDSEIFDVCLTEALDSGHNVVITDTDNITDTDKEVDIEKIKARLKAKS